MGSVKHSHQAYIISLEVTTSEDISYDISFGKNDCTRKIKLIFYAEKNGSSDLGMMRECDNHISHKSMALRQNMKQTGSPDRVVLNQ